MRYLLDTNIVSDLVRNPQGKVAQRIRKVGETQVCTSIVVAAELRYGAAKSDRRGSRRSWKRCLGRLKSCPLSHRWMQLMDRCALALSRRARQLAPTTCSSRPTRLPLVTRSSPITKRNSRVSRTFNYRIGCAKRRMLSRTILPYHMPLSVGKPGRSMATR